MPTQGSTTAWRLTPRPAPPLLLLPANALLLLLPLQVVAAGPRDMRMYYHSFDRTRQRFVVGLATSPDGFKWTKVGPIFEVRRGSTAALAGWLAHQSISFYCEPRVDDLYRITVDGECGHRVESKLKALNWSYTYIPGVLTCR